MTTGLILGTSLELNLVYEQIQKANFIYDSSKTLCPYYRLLPNLRLQVHNPSYFIENRETIKTEIEFDDTSDSFPNNSKILMALKKLYLEIPDLVYLSEEAMQKLHQGEKVIPEKLSIFLSKY